MSGPALSHVDSHRVIHESSRYEVQELVELMAGATKRGEEQVALQMGCLILEHFRSRTLRHAQAEVEGLYVETAQAHPDLAPLIYALQRDHDLLRLLVHELEVQLSDKVSLPNVYEAFLSALEKVNLHPHDVIAEIVDMRNDMTLLRIRCGPDYEQCLESSISTSELVALDTSILGQLEQLALSCREFGVNRLM